MSSLDKYGQEHTWAKCDICGCGFSQEKPASGNRDAKITADYAGISSMASLSGIVDRISATLCYLGHIHTFWNKPQSKTAWQSVSQAFLYLRCNVGLQKRVFSIILIKYLKNVYQDLYVSVHRESIIQNLFCQQNRFHAASTHIKALVLFHKGFV
jgi:hypothetical protein